MSERTFPANVVAVIPAFNENRTLSEVVRRTLPFVDSIIVVDDGSAVPLRTVLENHECITVIRHRMNLGKGAALKTGVLLALERGANIVVLLDGDGQHMPEEIPRLLEPINTNRSAIAIGVRSFDRRMPAMMRLGNHFFSFATAFLFGISISDTQSGFRAFQSAVYPKIEWESSRYEVETEMIVNIGKSRIKYSEVPIETVYHNKYKGTTVFDGIRIFLSMLLWRLV